MKASKEKKNIQLKTKGKAGFEEYYSSLFGERWQNLKESFAKESVYATFQLKDCEPYYLDPASVFAACQLPLEGAKDILDLCAAPGGKTLILASNMDDDACLVSNERSPARKNRLVQVCNQCLPESISSRIKISCSDGSKWCTTQTECYDRILLDVPCSSERHVFADEKYLDMWSPSRIKSLAIEQWALLSSAYRLLRNDGFLLYSTCALNPKENDEVISRLVKKFPNAEICFQDSLPEFNQKIFNCCQIQSIPNVERTEFGFHILPDVQLGMGPIWFTLVHKKIVNNEDM